DAVRQRVTDERPRRLRDQYLPAGARAGDPRGTHDVEPEIPLLADLGLAGVQPHAHPHLVPFRPRVVAQGALRGDRSGERVARAGEGVEERVALGVDLLPAAGSERLPDDAAVVARDGCVPVVPELLQQLGGALDVGEREGDCARVSRHARRPSAAADELDAVAVRVADETEKATTFAHLVRRALRLDPLLLQPGKRCVEILDADRYVAVARAELVRA